MPRGGKRPNSGPKRKLIAEAPVDKREAMVILEALDRPAASTDSYKIQQWRRLTEAGALDIALGARWKLFEHAHGRSVHTVNHLHDKPIEMNVNLSMSEIVRQVRKRKEEYERSGH